MGVWRSQTPKLKTGRCKGTFKKMLNYITLNEIKTRQMAIFSGAVIFLDVKIVKYQAIRTIQSHHVSFTCKMDTLVTLTMKSTSRLARK